MNLATIISANNQCTITPDSDFAGTDLKLLHNISSAEGCCAPCNATPGCNAFSFGFQGSTQSNTCWLKRIKSGSRPGHKTGRQVGSFNGPLPTPPPSPGPRPGPSPGPAPPAPGSLPCSPGSVGAALPFCNASLSFAERASDLVARIPQTDKPGLLDTTSGGVKSLGIAGFQWWSEGLHGVRCGHSVNCPKSGRMSAFTNFPEPIGSAASFNESLWLAIGSAIATEFRAVHNQQRGQLSIFSPNINVFRDGRW